MEDLATTECSSEWMRVGGSLAGIIAFASAATLVADLRGYWLTAILEGLACGLIVRLFRSGTKYERLQSVGPAAVFVGLMLVFEVVAGMSILLH